MAKRLSKLYKELTGCPIYTSASFLNVDSGFYNIQVNTSVRDYLRKTKRNVSKTITATLSSDTVITSSAYDSSDALASVPSHSGKRLGVLRETFDGTLKKRYVEVWRGSKLEAIKDVTKTHEDFLLHPTLFSLSFSKSESSLIYTAEAKAPEIDENSEDVDRNSKYRFIPDFGEKIYGKKRPTIYLFRWRPIQYEDEVEPSSLTEDTKDDADFEPTVVALKPDLPKDSTFRFGQGIFSPNDEHIFVTGHEQTQDGRQLSPHGCWNHPSAIFKFQVPRDIPKDTDEITVSATRLTSPTVAARSPRANLADSKDSYTVVWLSNPVGGPHTSAVSLWVLRSIDKKPRLLTDSVHVPKSLDAFPGLYVEQLPSNPFVSLGATGTTTSSSSHIITHSIRRSRQNVLRISLDKGEIETLVDDAQYSWTVLNTDGRETVLAKRSSMTSPEELLLGQLPKLEWKLLDKPSLSRSTREELNALQSEVITIPHRSPTEVITLRRAGKDKLPLPMVSFPHGGPHVSYTSEFSPLSICFASEGYHVNLINYTGSLGHGQKFVDLLLGRAGELDVQDSYHTIEYLIQLGYGESGPGKQFIEGGSHGGFLAAHLIGQYPNFFSAAVLRNPVISAGEILSVSDIPDWAYEEFGLPFGPTTTLPAEKFKLLQQMSPIHYVDAVKTPVLLYIGENDRRVPTSQGRNYYHALKGRGKKVEMLVYPNVGHSLDSVEAELAGFESMREWFARHK